MAPGNDSRDESLASSDTPADREDLPGELLGEELNEPEPYAVADEEAEELSATDPETTAEVDDPAQLAEAESLAARARSSRPVRRTPSAAVVAPKGAATPKARRASGEVVETKATGPVQFTKESVEELKKVVWPSWPTVQQLFWAVLVFVLAVIAYVGVLDLGFGWVLLKLFG